MSWILPEDYETLRSFMGDDSVWIVVRMISQIVVALIYVWFAVDIFQRIRESVRFTVPSYLSSCSCLSYCCMEYIACGSS